MNSIKIVNLILTIFVFNSTYAQLIQINSFDPKVGGIKNAIVTSSNQLVVSGNTGIYYINDTTLGYKISNEGSKKIFAGLFNNVLYSADGNDIISENLADSIYYTNSSPNQPGINQIAKLTQLSDGRIMYMQRISSQIVILDTNSTLIAPNSSFPDLADNECGGIHEYSSNKYFMKASEDDKVIALYDINSDSLTEIQELSYPGIGRIVTYDMQSNGKIYLMHEFGFATWNNGIIENNILFDSVAISLLYDQSSTSQTDYFGAISPVDNRFYALSNFELFMYNGDTIVKYDSTDGFQLDMPNPQASSSSIINVFFNSSGELHATYQGANTTIATFKIAKIDISQIQALEVEQINKIVVFPNPANNEINIRSKNLNFEDAEIELISISGLRINNIQKTNSRDNEISIQIDEQWPKGLYFLKINDHYFKRIILD